MNTDLFFPPPMEPSAIEAALTICSQCLVVDECLEDAIENGDDFGVRGGKSAKARLKYRVQRNRVSA